MKLVSLHWEPADGQGIMDGGDHDPATVDRETGDECAFCGAAGARLAATDDPRTVGDDPLCDRCRDALELDPD